MAPTTNTNYQAVFGKQYFLTMNADPNGQVLPVSSWQNAGTNVIIKAKANAGHSFTGWTGSGTGSYTGPSNPSSVLMNGPITETGHFSP